MSELLGLLVLVRSLRDDADQVEIILGFVSKETVEITDKSVHVSFAWKMKMLNKYTSHLTTMHLSFACLHFELRNDFICMSSDMHIFIGYQ